METKNKSRKTFFTIGLIFLIGFFVASMAGVLRFSCVPQEPRVSEVFAASSVRPPLSFADLAEKLKPAVVNISTTKIVKRGGGFRSPFGDEFPFDRFFGGDDFFRRFFGDMPERTFKKKKSLGSGFIINRDGYIFTNNHVVEKADKIMVRLSSGKEYDADVVGRDAKTDIALIKIKPAGDLPVVEIGDSDKLRVGDWVIAIGNPFGLEQTVTAGIVSAKGRVIGAGPYDNFIQTDASINPGNSGGPLFDLNGKVVGINTAIVARAQGIGFAIPVNMAKIILPELKEKGKVTRGWLGVTVQDITEDIAGNLKLKETAGALVSDVFEGDPADKAGIKAGDIIIEIDGKKIKDTRELLRIVASFSVGKKIDIKVLRDGKKKVLNITIAEREEKKELAGTEQEERESFEMMVQDITPEIARHLGLSDAKGVVVAQVKEGGSADEAGIKPGDVILQVNRVKVSSLKDYLREISRKGTGESCLLLIKRGKRAFFVAIRKG